MHLPVECVICVDKVLYGTGTLHREGVTCVSFNFLKIIVSHFGNQFPTNTIVHSRIWWNDFSTNSTSLLLNCWNSNRNYWCSSHCWFFFIFVLLKVWRYKKNVIRRHKSKKNRQYNGQMKRANNDLQNNA